MLNGNEFATMAGVYPALATLPPAEHVRAEQAVYRRLGAVMPPYMQALIASFLPVLLLERDRRSPAFRLTLAGAACYAVMLGVTATRNLPLNARIVALPPDESSVAEFRALQGRWNRLHAARNALNVIGLVLTSLGALPSARPQR